MHTLHSKLQHVFNSAHLYCRMLNAGIEHDDALKCAGEVEKLLKPYLYPEKKTEEGKCNS
jgi:hypothetical protein